MVAFIAGLLRSLQRKKTVDSGQYVQQFQRRLQARYDAARTTDENERHWANADYLSANAALTSSIRRKLRSRSRYECQENNSYAKGMILTLANDMIGTGPKLQLLTSDNRVNRLVEQSFAQWAEETRLAEKLRTMRVAKVVDGEAFALFGTNRSLSHPVSLDIQPVEADLISAPYTSPFLDESKEVDGIRFDDDANPTQYHLLDNHPGSAHAIGFSDGKWISGRNVMHVFRVDRAGQKRGVTEVATALPLFAMLRRFTLATLAAAETAADFAAIMKTSAGATVEATTLAEDQWFDAIPLEYRAMLTLPNGWDITQLKAEHPTTTYPMFKSEIINEIARCLNMPFNVAAANSSGYNYSSGRLDHQVYFKSIAVERHQWSCSILGRLFREWVTEAIKSRTSDDRPTVIALALSSVAEELRWSWFWDAHEHVDPSKEANAQSVRLASGTTSRKAEYAKAGIDVDQADAEAAESYGVTVEEYRRSVFSSTFNMAASQANEQASESQSEEEDSIEDDPSVSGRYQAIPHLR